MIVVIADDLTGAAEVAGIAHQRGLSVEVQTDQLYPSDCDVIVVDANSRSCEESVAVAKVRGIAQQVLLAEPELAYIKVDSVLRGHVAAELREIQRAFGVQRVLMLNANPRKGRTVCQGRLSIDGRPVEETCFASDPEHPRSSSEIHRLLSLDPEQVGLVSAGRPLPAEGLLVGNATSEADLLEFARSASGELSRSQSGLLPVLAGAGEFFEAVLDALAKSPPATGVSAMSPLEVENGSLMVSGSAAGCRGSFESVEIGDLPDVPAIARKVCEQLAEEGRAMLRTPGRKGGDAQSYSALLLEIALAVLATCKPSHLWIEGGRTASSLVRACGWQRLVPRAVHGDGVVRLQVVGQSAPSLILKPGSYPWPTSMDQSPSDLEPQADPHLGAPVPGKPVLRNLKPLEYKS